MASPRAWMKKMLTAKAMARKAGLPRVMLTGGCFQNALLTRLVRATLAREGFEPVSPMAFPPNDGASSLGQAAVAVLQSDRIV